MVPNIDGTIGHTIAQLCTTNFWSCLFCQKKYTSKNSLKFIIPFFFFQKPIIGQTYISTKCIDVWN